MLRLKLGWIKILASIVTSAFFGIYMPQARSLQRNSNPQGAHATREEKSLQRLHLMLANTCHWLEREETMMPEPIREVRAIGYRALTKAE